MWCIARRAALLLGTVALAGSGLTGVAEAATTVTYAGDALRTGWYPDQSALSPALVTGSTFGPLFKHDLEPGDQIEAQPLIVGSTLLVVTEQNRAYGLDAVTGAERWSRADLGAPVRTAESTADPATAGDAGCDVPRRRTGITGTPVVDSATRTAYFFAKRYLSDPGSIVYTLHALDVDTGAERPGFPRDIPEGLHADNQPGPTFEARWELQRPGLLLMDGVVYAAFAGHCDRGHYEGWVIGLSATTGALTAKWVAVAATPGAGIWQSGGGLVSDGPGRILLATGNGRSPAGTTPVVAPPANLGSSVVRLQVQADGRLTTADFFAPYNGELLDRQDIDFGSGGPVALPNAYFGTARHPNLMISTGKEGIVYLLDRNDLGGYRTGLGGGDRALQEAGPIGGVWSRPAVWPGGGGWVWVNTASGGGVGGGGDGRLEALGYGTSPSGDPLLTSGEGTSTDAFSIDSGSPIITSNGTDPTSGILWIAWAPFEGFGAQLRAYRAIPGNDGRPVLLASWPIGRSSKFQPPGVGAGRVYVTARGCLKAYEPGRCSTDTKAAVLGFGSPVVQPLSGASLRFVGTQVGASTTLIETFTATTAVTLQSVTTSDPGFTVGAAMPTLPAVLQAGEQVQVPVTFAPSAIATFPGTLTATTSQGSVTVGLSGDGLSAAPKLRVATTVSFGGVVVGTHASRAIRLFNDGGAPLQITGFTKPSPTSRFTVRTAIPNPFVIAPSSSALVEIDFDPTATGQFEGTIGLTSNGGAADVVLSGSSATAPRLAIAPSALDFGTVPIGSSVDRTFTLTNTGGSAAVISRSQPPGLGRFVALDALVEGTTLAPGASVTQTVRFTPGEAGAATDSWSLNANDDGGRREVVFTGTGAVAVPLAPPPEPAPGVVETGGAGEPVLPVLDRVAPRRAAIARRRRLLTLTVAEPVTARIVIERLTAGRRVSGRCRPPTAARRRAPRCTRAVVVRTLRPRLRAGATTLTLPRLADGRYRLTVTLTDAAGNASAPQARSYVVG